MKKPSVTSFLIAFLLAAAVCTHGQEEEVMDSSGNPVKVGEKYFIQPVKTESNPGGGLIPYDHTPLDDIMSTWHHRNTLSEPTGRIAG